MDDIIPMNDKSENEMIVNSMHYSELDKDIRFQSKIDPSLRQLCVLNIDSEGKEFLVNVGEPFDFARLAPFWNFFSILTSNYNQEYNNVISLAEEDVLIFLDLVKDIIYFSEEEEEEETSIGEENKSNYNHLDYVKKYRIKKLFNSSFRKNYRNIKHIIDYFNPVCDEAWIFKVKFNREDEDERKRLDNLLINIEKDYNINILYEEINQNVFCREFPNYWKVLVRKLYDTMIEKYPYTRPQYVDDCSDGDVDIFSIYNIIRNTLYFRALLHECSSDMTLFWSQYKNYDLTQTNPLYSNLLYIDDRKNKPKPFIFNNLRDTRGVRGQRGPRGFSPFQTVVGLHPKVKMPIKQRNGLKQIYKLFAGKCARHNLINMLFYLPYNITMSWCMDYSSSKSIVSNYHNTHLLSQHIWDNLSIYKTCDLVQHAIIRYLLFSNEWYESFKDFKNMNQLERRDACEVVAKWLMRLDDDHFIDPLLGNYSDIKSFMKPF